MAPKDPAEAPIFSFESRCIDTHHPASYPELCAHPPGGHWLNPYGTWRHPSPASSMQVDMMSTKSWQLILVLTC